MEKKEQLNFSAPLLSVRRHSSPRANAGGVNKKMMLKSPPGRQHSVPVQRSEWEGELEELSKPATIPFLWEKSPGRPKGECVADSSEEPSVIPRLPPGRLSDANRRSGEVFTPRLPHGRLADVRHRSGEVSSPRLPPGRHRSGEVSSPRFPTGRLSNGRHASGEVPTPRFLSGRLSNLRHRSGEISREQNMIKRQAEAFGNDHASLLESLKDSLYAEGESDKECGEDSFSDALDSLSPSESLSLNCSISGLNGSCNSSRTFSIDPQTRDLMMSRFLPAAKAMVLEIPQYVPRKQNVETEQPKLVKKIIPRERKPLLKQIESKASSFYNHNEYKVDVESEDGEDDHDDPGKRIGKSCGFFPRLCVKSSLSLLNPLPGTKSKTPPSTPYVGEVKRLTRNAYSGPLDKGAYDAIYKKRYHSGVLSQELHKAGNKLMNDPKRNSFSNDSYRIEGLSPRLQSRSGGISPYRNERPPSPFREGAKFLGLPKEVELKANKISSLIKSDAMFQEAPPQRSYKPVLKPSGDAVEKKLRMGSVNNKVTPFMNLNVSKSERSLLMTMEENRGAREHVAAKASVRDIEHQHVLEGSRDVNYKSGFPDKASTELPELARKMENLNLKQNLVQEKSSSEFTDLQYEGNLNTKNENNLKPDDQKESNAALLLSPLPPPLPKSPSESWLWRTISLRNPFSHSIGSHFHSKKQSQKESDIGTKWETMVKSSNIHHDHVRYSEELMSHIPHQKNRK